MEGKNILDEESIQREINHDKNTMQEKIGQLEALLQEFEKKFEYRLRIRQTTLEYYQNELQQLEKDYLETYPEKAENSDFVFNHLLESFKAKKQDNTFLENDVPKLKSLLLQTLNALDERTYIVHEGNLVPNEEFKRLVNSGIVTTTMQISSKFKGKTFVGYLTYDGFFELAIGDNKIPFSSFRTAAEYAWEKDMPNDCWSVWTANDKSGKNHSLKHYRDLLRQQHP
jgi:hypothetical protein